MTTRHSMRLSSCCFLPSRERDYSRESDVATKHCLRPRRLQQERELKLTGQNERKIIRSVTTPRAASCPPKRETRSVKPESITSHSVRFIPGKLPERENALFNSVKKPLAQTNPLAPRESEYSLLKSTDHKERKIIQITTTPRAASCRSAREELTQGGKASDV